MEEEKVDMKKGRKGRKKKERESQRKRRWKVQRRGKNVKLKNDRVRKGEGKE